MSVKKELLDALAILDKKQPDPEDERKLEDMSSKVSWTKYVRQRFNVKGHCGSCDQPIVDFKGGEK